MKKIGISLILAILTVSVSAQSVYMTSVLSTTMDLGASQYSGTYAPADDVFLSGTATNIQAAKGTDGTFDQDLDITGITPSGLGFFALAAAHDGSIFAYENGGNNIWKWTSKTATPALAYDGSTTPALFARCGFASGTGAGQMVAFTGSAVAGPIEIFSTSDGVTFSILETVPAADANAKSTLAMNDTMTIAYSAPDTGSPPNKAVKSGGVWSADPTFVSAATNNAGCVYDQVNNILFTIDGGGTTIQALDGDTGAELGNLTITNGANATEGYDGGQITVNIGPPAGGTFWFSNRGVAANAAAYNKVTYTIAPARVPDWPMF